MGAKIRFVFDIGTFKLKTETSGKAEKNTQMLYLYKNILIPLENGFRVFEIGVFDFQYLNLTGSGDIVGRSEAQIYFLLSSYYFSKYTKELSLNYNEGLISAAF